ncbi:MAG: hypothetical protein NTZ32_07610 [Planctomycetales bacterium]|nr:hypothetical protein [Planctomycetales bacterium]
MEAGLSERQLNQLLERVSKLETEVSQLKGTGTYGGGWEGIIGSQKDNQFFLEVIVEMEKERATEKAVMAVTPAKKRTFRRAKTTEK